MPRSLSHLGFISDSLICATKSVQLLDTHTNVMRLKRQSDVICNDLKKFQIPNYWAQMAGTGSLLIINALALGALHRDRSVSEFWQLDPFGK